MVLADTFWTSSTAQIVIAVVVGLVAFLLAWFLLGSAARAKKDREVEARMRASSSSAGGTAPSRPTSRVRSKSWLPGPIKPSPVGAGRKCRRASWPRPTSS